jgi:hypothetical protein
MFLLPPFFIPDFAMGLSQRISIIVLEVWLAAVAAHVLIATARSRRLESL